MAFFHELSRPKQAAEGKFGGSGADSADTTVPGGMLVLTLDDVLSRVPTRALKPGLHDPSRRLHFAMEELLDGISRGRATIMLSKLAERYPETFEAPAPGTEDSPVYLPLQKLIQQIGRATRQPPEKPVPPVIEPAPMVPVAKVLAPAPAPEPLPVEPDPIVEAPVTRLLRRLRVMQEPVERAPAPQGAGAARPRESSLGGEPPPLREAAPAPVAAPSAPAAPAASIPLPTPPAPTERVEAPNPSGGAIAPQDAATPGGLEEKAPGRAGVPPASEGVFARAVAEKLEPAPAPATAVPPLPDLPTPKAVANPPAPKAEPPKPEEKPAAVTPPPLPVAPPPEAKAPAPPPPAPVIEPAPEVPHSPILENPPANLETNVRIPSGRPLVRPPSLQGPAGLVAPETTPPPAPAMPGFVFAPRPKGQHSDFAQPAEAELPEVHIPPLFAVHPGPLEEEPPLFTHPQPPPPAAQPEPEPVKEPVAETPPAPENPPEPEPDEPPPSAHSNGSDESVPSVPSVADPADNDDATERRLLHPTRADDAVRPTDLLGTHFSLARIDQEPLQAIFMTEEFLDLARVSQLSCGFPGITGCMIVAGDALAQGGERPAGLDAQALCKLTKQLSAVAVAFPEELPAVQTYTLHVGNRALSIFARPHVSLCLVHSHRGFLPGVRERLAAVADTLSRGLSGEADEG